jgi:hypothetical protein
MLAKSNAPFAPLRSASMLEFMGYRLSAFNNKEMGFVLNPYEQTSHASLRTV